jgi:predicted outer membrane protein
MTRAHAILGHASGCVAAAVLLFVSAPVAAQADHLENLARAEQPSLTAIEAGTADHAFLTFALDRARVKRQLLEIALQRTASPEMQVLAETMHEEHVAVAHTLLELAGQDLAATATSMAEHPELAHLRQLPPEQLDQRMLAQLQALHRETLPRYLAAERDPQLDGRVRDFARETVPLLQMHLELIGEAEQLLAAH